MSVFEDAELMGHTVPSAGNRRAQSQAGLGLDPGAVLSTCSILWKDLLSRLCKLPGRQTRSNTRAALEL